MRTFKCRARAFTFTEADAVPHLEYERVRVRVSICVLFSRDCLSIIDDLYTHCEEQGDEAIPSSTCVR